MQETFAEVTAVVDIPSQTQTGFEISSLAHHSHVIREKRSFAFSCIPKCTLIRSLFFGEITEVSQPRFSDQ